MSEKLHKIPEGGGGIGDNRVSEGTLRWLLEGVKQEKRDRICKILASANLDQHQEILTLVPKVTSAVNEYNAATEAFRLAKVRQEKAKQALDQVRGRGITQLIKVKNSVIRSTNDNPKELLT